MYKWWIALGKPWVAFGKRWIALALALARHGAAAQTYPTRPLKIVVPGPDNIRRRNLDTYFQSHGVEVEAMLEMDAMIATLEFVARSDYVTILPSVISVNDIGRNELMVNPIVSPELHAEFVVIQPTRRTLSTQARMFLQRFEAEVAHIHDVWDEAIAGPAMRKASA